MDYTRKTFFIQPLMKIVKAQTIIFITILMIIIFESTAIQSPVLFLSLSLSLFISLFLSTSLFGVRVLYNELREF